jgi:superkiller protein 8
VISASGSSSLKVHSTVEPDYPLRQTLVGAHPLGCKFVASSNNGRRFGSVGFGDDIAIWTMNDEGEWSEEGRITGGPGLLFYTLIDLVADKDITVLSGQG